MPYKMLNPVDADEVPDWQRNPPKWAELVDAALNLEPGKTLPVLFAEYDNNLKVAKRARDAVRDQANLKVKAVVVRTRVVDNGDGTATLFLTRVFSPEESA